MQKLSNIREYVSWNDDLSKDINDCIEYFKSLTKIENKSINENESNKRFDEIIKQKDIISKDTVIQQFKILFDDILNMKTKCIAQIKITDEDMEKFLNRLERFEVVYNLFKYHLNESSDLLLGWHSNIACWLIDNCGLSREVANEKVVRFMNRFYGIDYDWEELVDTCSVNKKDVSLLDKLKSMKNIQADSLTDDYMVGLYNGLELAIATIEDREPSYKEPKREMR